MKKNYITLLLLLFSISIYANIGNNSGYKYSFLQIEHLFVNYLIDIDDNFDVSFSVESVNSNEFAKSRLLAPVAVCQDITVQLDSTGNATIIAADVDNGSSGLPGFTLSIDITSFVCTDIGVNTVTLTVTDTDGSVFCTSTVTVQDNINPTISCPANVTVSTDAGLCTASAVSLGIAPSGSDNCSVASVTNDAPATYSLGVTNVTWTVTDGSGNTNSCIQTVRLRNNFLIKNTDKTYLIRILKY